MQRIQIPQYESKDEALDAEFGSLEHADNFRIARVGNEVEMLKYVTASLSGCCGAKDTVVSIKYGEDYYELCLIGCNYGH